MQEIRSTWSGGFWARPLLATANVYILSLSDTHTLPFYLFFSVPWNLMVGFRVERVKKGILTHTTKDLHDGCVKIDKMTIGESGKQANSLLL